MAYSRCGFTGRIGHRAIGSCAVSSCRSLGARRYRVGRIGYRIIVACAIALACEVGVSGAVDPGQCVVQLFEVSGIRILCARCNIRKLACDAVLSIAECDGICSATGMAADSN